VPITTTMRRLAGVATVVALGAGVTTGAAAAAPTVDRPTVTERTAAAAIPPPGDGPTKVRKVVRYDRVNLKGPDGPRIKFTTYYRPAAGRTGVRVIRETISGPCAKLHRFAFEGIRVHMPAGVVGHRLARITYGDCFTTKAVNLRSKRNAVRVTAQTSATTKGMRTGVARVAMTLRR
jgi:hypothetical protein